MATAHGPDTGELLAKARQGDASAVERLLDRHRDRLLRMVTARMDEKLTRRSDASRVVDAILAAASQRLSEYPEGSTSKFYVWLRQIAFEILTDLAGGQVEDEEGLSRLSDKSSGGLVLKLLGQRTNPTDDADLRRRVRATLARMSRLDREILILRHLEELSINECAEVLGITEEAAKKHYVRALRRLRELLEDLSS